MLLRAQRNTPSYDDFLADVLQTEIDGRDEKQAAIRMRLAKLPAAHNLDLYDQSATNGLRLTQLKQLRELHWLEDSYNILLAGPSGVGKTFIAAGCAMTRSDAATAGSSGRWRA